MKQTHETSAARTQSENATAEPLILRKRIGSTTIEVAVHFSRTSKETMEDKFLRIMEREVDKIA